MEARLEPSSCQSSELDTFSSAMDAAVDDIDHRGPNLLVGEMRDVYSTSSGNTGDHLISEEGIEKSTDEIVFLSSDDDFGIMEPLGRTVDATTDICLMDAVLNKKFQLDGVEIEQNGVCSALKNLSCPVNSRAPLGASPEYRARTLSANGIRLVLVPESRTAQSWAENSQPSSQKGNTGRARKRKMKALWRRAVGAFGCSKPRN